MQFLLKTLDWRRQTAKTITHVYAALLLGLVVWLDATAAGAAVLAWIHRVPFLDKAIHFVAVGGLAYLLNQRWPEAALSIGPLCLPRGTAVAIGLASLEEFSQLAFTGRIFSIGDLASNVAGALVLGRLCTKSLESERGITADAARPNRRTSRE